MPFRSEKQRRWMWANEPKMARKWTDEHGSTPVKAKVGKYQELEHPQHDILPLEHMEEKVSSKERIERLLDERKKKKESKKQLVKAVEGELVRQQTRGTGAAVKGTEHYTMKGMPTAQTGQLIQTPTRGTGAAVKVTDHYVMEGMDAAKEGKMIKAKKGIFSGAASSMYDKPPGWDVKKISSKTSDKLMKLFKHRETGGWSPAAGKQYKKYLKSLKKATVNEFGLNTTKGGSKTRFPRPDVNKRTATSFSIKVDKHPAIKGKWKSSPPGIKSKSFYFKDTPKPSTFLQRRITLGGARALPLKSVAKLIAKRTAIGKAVVAATVVAGAYEAGKRKWFTKDKKKVDKKSIGGESVVMKSGGGYVDDLL